MGSGMVTAFGLDVGGAAPATAPAPHSGAIAPAIGGFFGSAGAGLILLLLLFLYMHRRIL